MFNLKQLFSSKKMPFLLDKHFITVKKLMIKFNRFKKKTKKLQMPPHPHFSSTLPKRQKPKYFLMLYQNM